MGLSFINGDHIRGRIHIEKRINYVFLCGGGGGWGGGGGGWEGVHYLRN